MEELTKKNLKTVLKVWALTILISLIALFGVCLLYAPTLVDMPYWDHYRNKMVIISASIDAYKAEKGELPADLTEVEPMLSGFLKAIPVIKEEYLGMPWTTKKNYSFFEGTKFGYKIWYLTDKSNYYLYFPMSKVDKTYFTQQELEATILHKATIKGSVVVIKNGKWVKAPWHKNEEPITLQNMEKYLKHLSRYGSSPNILYRLYEILWDLFHPRTSHGEKK